MFSALNVVNLSSDMPVEGGVYLIAGRMFAPFAGFIAGRIWIFSNIIIGVVESLGFAHYFSAIFPIFPLKGIASVFNLIFILINFHDIHITTLINNSLVLAKILILL